MNAKPYIDLLKRGPFPGRIDPWAETGDYFRSIHADMISHIVEQLQDPLLERGYIVSREASLQILGGGIPDVSVRLNTGATPIAKWDYVAAALSLHIEPGIESRTETADLQGLSISHMESGALVTVIEVVSPSNKVNNTDMEFYRDKRLRLWEQGVNIVEIDSTRSKRRLFEDVYTVELFPYHTTIFIADELPRIIGSAFGEPLKQFALPLRQEVVPVDPHAAYEHGYRLGTIAGNLERNHEYQEQYLPFPSLIPTGTRAALIEAVAAWRAQLAALRST